MTVSRVPEPAAAAAAPTAAARSPTLAHRAEYYALRGVVGALHGMPWAAACAFGERLGTFGYAPLGIRRRVVERQIAAAFPELSGRDVRDLARRSYAHLGRTTIEAALLPSLGRRGVVDLVESEQGFDAIERGVAAGHGVVLVCGHFGNWELSAAYVAARGLPIDVIVRDQGNPLFDAYVNETRTRLGLHVVRDRDAVRRTARALREGRAVGFVADQGVLGLASTFVPFFGRPAKTPRGPAVFALRNRVPALFVAVIRQPSGRYRFVAEEILVHETGDRERDVDAVVAAYTATLERWVRTAPEQYFWHHRRWRRQPADTPDELRDPSR